MRANTFKNNLERLQRLNANTTDYYVSWAGHIDAQSWVSGCLLGCPPRPPPPQAWAWRGMQVGVNQFVDLTEEELNTMNGMRGLYKGIKCPASPASSSSSSRVVAMALESDVSGSQHFTHRP